jgi:hypothetical protein
MVVPPVWFPVMWDLDFSIFFSVSKAISLDFGELGVLPKNSVWKKRRRRQLA